MSTFDLRKFLIENKLTRNSRILSEDIKFVDRDDALNVRNKNVQQRNKNYREKQARKNKPFNTYSDDAKRLLFEPDEITTRTGDYDLKFDPYDETRFDFTLQDLRNNAKGSWPRFVEGLNILFLDDYPTKAPDDTDKNMSIKATDWLKDLITIYIKYMLGYKELPKDFSHYVILNDPEITTMELNPTKKDKKLTAGERKLKYSQALFRLTKEYRHNQLKKIFNQFGPKGILMYIHEYIATVGKDYQQDIFQGSHMKDPSEKKPKSRKKSSRRPYAKVSPGQTSFFGDDPSFTKKSKDLYQDTPYESGDTILYDPENGDIINWSTGEILNVVEEPGKKPNIRVNKDGKIIDYITGKVIGDITKTIKRHEANVVYDKHGNLFADTDEKLPTPEEAYKLSQQRIGKKEKKKDWSKVDPKDRPDPWDSPEAWEDWEEEEEVDKKQNKKNTSSYDDIPDVAPF